MSRIASTIFDPSQPAKDGSFWHGRQGGVERALLDRLVYEVAMPLRPEDPANLLPASVRGGIARFDDTTTFVFRFANGGRDHRGRPGRWVLIVAAVPAADAGELDLTSILTCNAFQDVVHRCPQQHPIEPFDNQSIEVLGLHTSPDPVIAANLIQYHKISLDDKPLAEVAHAIASVPLQIPFVCHVKHGAGKMRASLMLSATSHTQPHHAVHTSDQVDKSAPALANANKPFWRLSRVINLGFAMLLLLFAAWLVSNWMVHNGESVPMDNRDPTAGEGKSPAQPEELVTPHVVPDESVAHAQSEDGDARAPQQPVERDDVTDSRTKRADDNSSSRDILPLLITAAVLLFGAVLACLLWAFLRFGRSRQ